MKVSNVFLIVLVFSLFISSCRSSKDVYRDRDEVKNISDSRLIKSVESNYLVYNSLYIKKFNAEVSINGTRKAFSGSLFLQRDSHLIMTVTPLLGIELFRAKLEKDSVFLIDRTKKSIHIGTYDLVEKNTYLDISFNILQSIFTNEFFVVNENLSQQVALKRFKHYTSEDGYLFTSVKLNRSNKGGRMNNLIQIFEILPGVYKINKTVIQDTGNQTNMIIHYSELIKVGEVWFPSKMEITGSRGNQKFEVTISFNSIDIDSNNRLSFHKPGNYKQVIVK